MVFADFVKYFSGKYSKKEQYSFEKKVMQDPFDQDAYDGISNMNIEDFQKDIEELNSHFKQKSKRKLPVYLSIAASIVLLGTIVFSIVLISNNLGHKDYVAEDVRIKEETTLADEENIKETNMLEHAETEQKDPIVQENEDENIEPKAKKEIQNYQTEKGINVRETIQDIDSKEEELDMSTKQEPAAVATETTEIKEVTVVASNIESKSSVTGAVSRVTAAKLATAKKQQLEIIENETLRIKGRKKVMDVDELMETDKNSDRFLFKGRIIDDYDNNPLPGVNVLVQGTSNGTVTNVDGAFELEVKKGDVLDVNFIGYMAEEIKVKNNDSVEVELTEDMMALEEVVVIGYGSDNEAMPKGHESARPSMQMKEYKEYILKEINSKWFEVYDGEVVRIQFNISASGIVSDFKILKSPDEALANEIIQIVQKGPVWNSAKMNDDPIDSKVKLRVKIESINN